MTRLHKRDHDAVRLQSPLRIKRASPQGIVEGYASTFNDSPDSYGDVVAVGAFAKSLAAHKAADTMPPMLWAHDQSTPVGRWDEMREDATGLFVVGTLNLDVEAGRDALAHVKHGDVGGLSIGYRIAPGGIRFEADFAVLTEVKLMEVSLVCIPANGNARVSGVKAISTKSGLVDFLREAGLPKAAARRVAAGGFAALAADGAETEDIESIKAALSASANRWSATP